MSFWSVLFGFTVGTLFLLIGGMTLWAGQWIGLYLVAIALFLLPPVRFLVFRRTGKTITPLVRTFTISVILALFVISIEHFGDNVMEEMEPQVPAAEPEAS